MNKDQNKAQEDFLFEGLPTFNITIKDPKDAKFICEAVLLRVSNGNTHLAHNVLATIMSLSLEKDPEIVMKNLFDEAKQKGLNMPEFVKPVFTHIMRHLLKQHEILQAIDQGRQ